ncbi:MAG: phosphatidate cytidylyltransferase [Phycisphaerae bacterium]
MVRQRVGFGTAMIALLVGLVWLDDALAQRVADDLSPGLLINIGLYLHEGLLLTLFVAVVAVFAGRELSRLLRGAGSEPAGGVAYLSAVALIVIPWFVRNGLDPDVSADVMTDYAYSFTVLVIAVAATFLAVARRRRTIGATGAIGATLLVIVYTGLLAGYVVRLRMWAGSGASWLVLYFLLVVKICDIGAYFTGMALGRRRLIEWLSPKKTWEGLAGGVAASMVVATGVAWLVREQGPARLRMLFPEPRSALVFGAVMALVGQAGDLVESLFKRAAGSKDSGAVVPAFGGVLDIVDSPLLAAPLAYWMLVKS